MIKIGDFSKLAHVSIKTLHHYDEIGLLEPIHVDRYTGYRYYELEQLRNLNRVLALKDLGFSLDQVTHLLNEDLSIDEMKGMLRMKQLDLSEKLQDEQARLNRVDFRLSQLENEALNPSWDIATKKVDDQIILTTWREAAGEGALQDTKTLLSELLQDHLDQARLKPAGPWFTFSNDQPYDENCLEINLAVPVNLRRNQHPGDWEGSLVSLECLSGSEETVSLVHEGNSTTLPGVYTHLYDWMTKNRYQMSGRWREIYLSDYGSKTNTIKIRDAGIIEVQGPVQRVSIPVALQPTLKEKEEIMEPTYTNKPAFQAIGISYIGKNENNEIPGIWNKFNQRHLEIRQNDDKCVYGLCFTTPDVSIGKFEPGEFEYVASAPVDDGGDLPEGMVLRQVPAYKYAVFTHHGKLDTLRETYKFIYETWIPQAGDKVHPDKFDMEVYTDEFKFDSDESKFYIYVALID